MSNQPDEQKLVLALSVSDEAPAHAALSKLSAMSEHERRRVLRPHWEDPDGITDEADIALRRGFDLALNRLAALELGVSTGYLSLEAAAGSIEHPVRNLFKSRAVARFIDDYDYFQVRFLAARIDLKDFRLPRLLELPVLAGSPERDETVGGFLEQTLALQKERDVQRLYAFLDDYTHDGLEKGSQHERFRLWLADGGAETEDEVVQYFESLKRAVATWVLARYETYRDKPEPVQARFAVFDIYWLLKLFNAEISTSGDVSYCGSSWLTLLAESPHFGDNQKEPDYIYEIVKTGAKLTRAEMLEARRTLRRALGLACDWIRGEAIEEEPAHHSHPSKQEPTPATWIDAFKAELREIFTHRTERHLVPTPDAEPFAVRHGLIGVAFSGGGIRSATFNLGILEALKENDFLRLVDYLSTVSGGGYIGGWLVANAKRRGYWIRREADWRDSVKHLRDYSNYLSPHLGFMSPDTWTMWTTFLRNTILVQLQVFLAIAACLLLPYLLRFPFLGLLEASGQSFYATPEFLSAVLLAAATVLVCASLLLPRRTARTGSERDRGRSQLWIWVAVFVFVPASLSLTAVLWRAAAELLKCGQDSFGKILVRVASSPDMLYVHAACYVTLAALAAVSVKKTWRGLTAIALAPAGALAALLLEVSALILVLQRWVSHAQPSQAGQVLGSGFESAFVFGPALVIVVLSLTVYILIGMLGRASDRQPREWWSRFGALLSITGTAWLMLSVAAVYSPFWFEKLVGIKWIPVLGWIATSLGSVMAGKSGRTAGPASADASGDGGSKASQLPLEVLAVAGPFVAIAGLVIVLSTALHAVLLAVSSTTVGGSYWEGLRDIDSVSVLAALGVVLAASLVLTWRVDINIFGLSEFYRSRLVRCYLGATRSKRSPHPFTGFDEKDDLLLACLRTVPPPDCVPAEEGAEGRAPFAGPFPIVNCTLNLGGSSDLAMKTRHSDCFTMTPLHCGFNHRRTGSGGFATGGYSPTEGYCGQKESPSLGLAVAVSGAAASPNMGYHTSPLTSFLMTVFNARLGCWFANPSHTPAVNRLAPHFAFPSLLKELLGTASDGSPFVDISDGGHFENLGVYELVRRRCRLIIACDAECDPEIEFESLGKVIRLCEVDFGAKIKIDVASIRRDPRTGRSKSHCAVGRIEYGNGILGALIYIKASLLEEENTAVLQYHSEHPVFPHETTADQFFTEDQFESYRKLGYDCAKRTFRDAALKNIEDDELENFAQQLTDLWTPVKNLPASFISSTTALSRLWETLGTDPQLLNLSNEIINHTPPPPGPPSIVTPREFYFCNEIIQLMENVHLDLKLDDTWDDPDNAGWKDLFLKCSRSATFRIVWEKSCDTYGKRFHYFCRRKLNLK
jgi:hypothetical protein